MGHLIGFRKGAAAGQKWLFVLTCTTCLCGVGDAMATGDDNQPPAFDPSAFVAAMQTQTDQFGQGAQQQTFENHFTFIPYPTSKLTVVPVSSSDISTTAYSTNKLTMVPVTSNPLTIVPYPTNKLVFAHSP